jgi:hypothetical protein
MRVPTGQLASGPLKDLLLVNLVVALHFVTHKSILSPTASDLLHQAVMLKRK